MSTAKVFLVGAGPGDPGLITAKGLSIIRRADVIIYDYLANPRLLADAAAGAEIIYAGKTGHHHHIDQESINNLLIDKAKSTRPGGIVCRLKGGDSFVFGRGGEEALALREAGIDFEVVPGVSSVYAAAAYAGIPVTHRGVASDVAFVTGHEDPTKGESSINWDKLARGVGTVVFVMGVTNLPHIAAEMMKHGRAADTPVALISWGTTPRQRTLVGELRDIAEKAAAEKLRPPAIIVIGDVVRLRDQIEWYEKKPLFGKRILVTRATKQASAFVSALEELGADTVTFPAIETRPLDDYSILDRAIAELAEGRAASHGAAGGGPAEWSRRFDWIIFTSPNGVDYFFRRLIYHGLDLRVLGSSKIAAIGSSTAKALMCLGIIPDLVPKKFVAEGMMEALWDAGLSAKSRVLLPRALVARDLLPREFEAAGIDHLDAPAYETVPATGKADQIIKMLQSGELDYLTFTSSSTVDNFVAAIKAALVIGGDTSTVSGDSSHTAGAPDVEVGDSASDPSSTGDSASPEALRNLVGNAKIVSIGPITSDTIRSYGLVVAVECEESTIDFLVRRIAAEAVAERS